LEHAVQEFSAEPVWRLAYLASTLVIRPVA
jgi:hypothetical protein